MAPVGRHLQRQVNPAERDGREGCGHKQGRGRVELWGPGGPVPPRPYAGWGGGWGGFSLLSVRRKGRNTPGLGGGWLRWGPRERPVGRSCGSGRCGQPFLPQRCQLTAGFLSPSCLFNAGTRVGREGPGEAEGPGTRPALAGRVGAQAGGRSPRGVVTALTGRSVTCWPRAG